MSCRWPGQRIGGMYDSVRLTGFTITRQQLARAWSTTPRVVDAYHIESTKSSVRAKQPTRCYWSSKNRKQAKSWMGRWQSLQVVRLLRSRKRTLTLAFHVRQCTHTAWCLRRGIRTHWPFFIENRNFLISAHWRGAPAFPTLAIETIGLGLGLGIGLGIAGVGITGVGIAVCTPHWHGLFQVIVAWNRPK